MRSMTGFGQAAEEGDHFRAQVTLRAVNHRFFDLVFRLREEQRELEAELRALFAAELERGRVEASIELEPVLTRPVEVKIDEALVRALHAACHDLGARGLLTAELRFGDLLRLPEVVQVRSEPPQWSDGDRRAVLGAARRALAQLVAARELEGGKLAAILAGRLAELETLRARLAARAVVQPAELAEALRRRIAELLAAAVPDENRLAQEVALLVDKSDVREELDRLRSHVEHFRALLESAGSSGKRLDFLAQEIFRELNTVGAKCRDAEMTRWVLDGKVCCEQLREQVQNVE